MEFAPPNLNVYKLKRKIDISDLTINIAKMNGFSIGRFYLLWRNGHYIVIQAEPWCRPDVSYHDAWSERSNFLEESRALCHIQEVIQAMLDTIVIDGENNWAYLVRLKDNTYRLVYKKRQLVHNCPIWTKVVELDDIELTRFMTAVSWEGIYQGKDVDIFIGCTDLWGFFISSESRGQKLVESRGLGHYFFKVEGHVSKNGLIVGIMVEARLGRPVTLADRSAVFEAIADIQRHGISFVFQLCDVYITERGVRFANACSAKYYRDRDELAEKAKCTWKELADMFNHMDKDPMTGLLSGSRYSHSTAFIIPRLPSPGRPIPLRPEDAILRWAWSITMSENFPCGSTTVELSKLEKFNGSSRNSATRRGKRIKDGNIDKNDQKALLPPDEFSSNIATSISKSDTVDQPLVVHRGPASRRHHPYVRLAPGRLLLPPDDPQQEE